MTTVLLIDDSKLHRGLLREALSAKRAGRNRVVPAGVGEIDTP